MTYLVKEKKDQSVEITSPENEVTNFYPDNNLEKSKELLSLFNNLETIEGKKLYEYWVIDDFYILPALQEWLFWEVFVGKVSHKKTIDFLKNKKYKILKSKFWVVGRIARWIRFKKKNHNFIKRFSYNFLASLLRSRFKYRASLLIHDDGYDGFRFKKIKETLKKNILFHRTERMKPRQFKRLFFDRNIFVQGSYYIFEKNKEPILREKIPNKLRDYFSENDIKIIINKINKRYLNLRSEVKVLKKFLKNKKINHLLSYDQVEECLALLIVFKSLKRKSLSYQHGPLTDYHSGWIGFGIPKVFCNLVPNQLILWGSFWRDFIINKSNKYNNENTIVGPHLNKIIDYENFLDFQLPKKEINVLVPFEFLANNIQVSQYLEKLINMNWNITIKLRPNGDINSDHEAFSLEVQKKANFVMDLSKEQLSKFNIVIFTQSVFAIELMYLNIPLWYLETDFNFLNLFAKKKLAHKIDLVTLDKISKNKNILNEYLKPLHTLEDYKKIFFDKPLIEIEDHIF